jgi:hydroxypyruvate isomerase
MPRFSANLGLLWPDRPLLGRIEAAARAGFRAIEMQFPYETPPDAVGALCRRLDLTVLGINTPIRPGERGVGAVSGREREFEAGIEQAIDYCRRSGASAIHVMAGDVPPEARVRARGVFADNLRRAAALMAETGLTLLLEPLNPRDNPGYFYARLDEAAGLIGDLGLANLRLQFDVYHVGVTEGDVLTKLGRYLPIIGNVQIAAVPSRAEPDEGEIAYRAVFAELDRLGYDGWVGCEYHPRGATEAGLAWTTALGVAL